jgi:hypothetical protein
MAKQSYLATDVKKYIVNSVMLFCLSVEVHYSESCIGIGETFAKFKCIGFEVLKMVTVKNAVFWLAMPCNSEPALCFGEVYYLHP